MDSNSSADVSCTGVDGRDVVLVGDEGVVGRFLSADMARLGKDIVDVVVPVLVTFGEEQYLTPEDAADGVCDLYLELTSLVLGLRVFPLFFSTVEFCF